MHLGRVCNHLEFLLINVLMTKSVLFQCPRLFMLLLSLGPKTKTTLAAILMLVFALSSLPWGILVSHLCSLCTGIRMVDNNQHVILQV